MKFLATTTFLFIAFFAFTSCDCLQRANGIVLDKQSNLPLDSVTVKRVPYADNGYEGYKTDGKGKFEIHFITGGLKSCSHFKLAFSKKGYETLIKDFKACCSENDTILLISKSQ
jgi:hypothetical protein